MLDGIELSPEVKVITIDQPAVAPQHPVRPRRTLILLLALFGGLMLGVFAAFFAEFLGRSKEDKPIA